MPKTKSPVATKKFINHPGIMLLAGLIIGAGGAYLTLRTQAIPAGDCKGKIVEHEGSDWCVGFSPSGRFFKLPITGE